MNILEIEAFLAIIDTQSISKASDKLYISQSTVSNRLHSIENTIGEVLINRSQGIKSITLTPKGKEFLSFANRYMSFIKDLENWKQNTAKFELKIAGPLSLNSYVFPTLFKDLVSKDYPLTLNVSSHWNDTIYNLLEIFNLDIGIVSRSYSSKSLVTEPLFLEKMVMISDTRYSNYKAFINADTLDVSDEIYLDFGTDFVMWHNQIWSPSSAPKLIVDAPALIEYFLQNLNAWAIVTLSVALYLQSKGNIKISEVQPAIPNRTIFKIVQRNPNPSSKDALKIFEDELEKFISSNVELINI